METHVLATADGQVLQVPLTCRGAPRAGAEGSLVTTTTHTTLGDRRTYDPRHDPVDPAVLAAAIATLRVLSTTTAGAVVDGPVLTGTWPGQEQPVLLAVLEADAAG